MEEAKKYQQQSINTEQNQIYVGLNKPLIETQKQQHKTKLDSISIQNKTQNDEDALLIFQNYQPISQNFNINQLHKSNKLKLKKYKDSLFYGQFINNKRHGKGIMKYSNGRVYEGEWQNDVKHGIGYQFFTNQTNYMGEFINGKPHGTGRFSWPNGEFYEGQWENGLRHGVGVWKGAKGDSYVGEWKFGKANGKGVHIWINGDKYEGQFKQSVKHGEGIQQFKNGDSFKGSYAFGKPNGYGQYFWGNGSCYKGIFLGGRRNGNGVWRGKNNDKYEGQYLNDQKHGYGIFTWSKGSIYKGNYLNDSRSGYGQLYWPDGSYYKGEWKNGKQNGEGELYRPENGIVKGIFQENQIIYIEKQIKKSQINKIKTTKTDSFKNYSMSIKQINPQSIKTSMQSYQKEIIEPKNQIKQKLKTIDMYRQRMNYQKRKNTIGESSKKDIGRQSNKNEKFYIHRTRLSQSKNKSNQNKLMFHQSFQERNLLREKFNQIQLKKKQRYFLQNKGQLQI